MKTEHGHHWDSGQMSRSLNRASAFEMLKSDGSVTVKTVEKAFGMRAVIEIFEPFVSRAVRKLRYNVSYLDKFGRIGYIHNFRRVVDKLLLNVLRHYTYPNRQAKARSDACHTGKMIFNPQNEFYTMVWDGAYHYKYTTANDHPSMNWEPIPEFGHWDSLISLRR